MFLSKLKMMAAIAVAACVIGTGAAGVTYVIGKVGGTPPSATEHAQRQTAAEAILNKAIQAHGGEKNLRKLRITRMTIKYKTKAPGDGEIVRTVEETRWFPDKRRTVDMGKNGKLVIVLNGDRSWAYRDDGKVGDHDAQTTKRSQESLYRLALELLYPLKEKTYQLTVLDEAQVNGRPAVGLKVASKGHDDVKLYFDKDSGLLVKKASWGGALLYEVLSDYKEVGGLKIARKLTIQGQPYEVTEVKFLDKIDNAEFEKP